MIIAILIQLFSFQAHASDVQSCRAALSKVNASTGYRAGLFHGVRIIIQKKTSKPDQASNAAKNQMLIECTRAVGGHGNHFVAKQGGPLNKLYASCEDRYYIAKGDVASSCDADVTVLPANQVEEFK